MELLMDTYVMFLDCPEYMDKHGTVRRGLPAEVVYHYEVASTDGLLESAKIRCPRGHWFNGPVEFLTWDKHPATTIRDARVIHSRDVASAPARKGHAN
jgi:hypothetical protein